MENTRVIDFIKKVGKGKTLSKPLSLPEAKEAFEQIVLGHFTPAQLGAFLQALRIKEVSLDELIGFATGMQNQTLPRHDLHAPNLILNFSLDSPRKKGMLCAIAAHLLPYLEVDVGMVTNKPILAKNFESIQTTFEYAQECQALAKRNIPQGLTGKVHRTTCDELIPGWEGLHTVRSELGFRSLLHTLEKLVNPWKVGPMVLGISHEHYAERLVKTLQFLKYPNSKIILGNHGSLDLNLHKPTKYFYWKESVQWGIIPSPEELGLEIPNSLYNLHEFGAWKEKLLTRDPGFINALNYHLAFCLWCCGKASSLKIGLEQVKQTGVSKF